MRQNKPFILDLAIIVVVCSLSIVGCSGSDESVGEVDEFHTVASAIDVNAEKSKVEDRVSEEEMRDQMEKDIESFAVVTDESTGDSPSFSEIGSNSECEISDNNHDSSNRNFQLPIHYISGEIKYNIRDGLSNEGILRWDKPVSAEFYPLTLTENPPYILLYPFTSEYSLNLKNELGEVVYKTPIRVHGINYTWNIYEHDIQWPSETLPFDTWIVDPPEYASYAIYNNDIELASLELSKHFPEVEVIEPKTCSIIGGSDFEVSWAGSDKDNNALVYSVEYSFFDEQAGYWIFNEIAENVPGASLSIKRSEIYNPTSSRSKIRVIVSDGTRSSYAESGIFYVSNSPSVAIKSYDEGETYEITDFILSAWTTGFVYSTFDDPSSADDLNFNWHSNINGFLGNGEQIRATLSSGDHIITVTVSDRYGNSASDTIQFKVRNELS